MGGLAFLGGVPRLGTSLVLTLLGLLLVTFLIGRVVPIDPVLAAVGDRAPPDVYERVKEELGLNLPLWRQFLIYVGQVLHGDLGNSVLTARPVLEDIRRVFPATLELATLATLIGIVLGVPMGVLAATQEGRWPDQVVRIASITSGGTIMPTRNGAVSRNKSIDFDHLSILTRTVLCIALRLRDNLKYCTTYYVSLSSRSRGGSLPLNRL